MPDNRTESIKSSGSEFIRLRMEMVRTKVRLANEVGAEYQTFCSAMNIGDKCSTMHLYDTPEPEQQASAITLRLG
jgi:hypothetical protein